ncbi:hypothetical protein [Lentibacillus amyloliquefaciens]|uniref:Uncharacterized protein n=1 Tax=Lentibacillus amyloliquefaciens TaxID=1472767 RepID=A0A0U3W407_9BACI|nr:hypothetical protein [Lentibacillus amyloliquefaciens]ALX47904.1 hypothetical protein AOX59_04375 [Lentibacillus amyloliquefaciens]
MSSEQTRPAREKPMRVILPDLHHEITKQLEEQHNIHPYDIQTKVTESNSGYQVTIYFGDSFAHRESQHFSSEAIENKDPVLSEFVEKIGDTCKEVMIADYYKMMRPT